MLNILAYLTVNFVCSFTHKRSRYAEVSVQLYIHRWGMHPACIRAWLKQWSVAVCCGVVLYTGSSVESVLELVRCSGDMELTEGEDAWFDCQLQWTRPVSASVSVTVSWYKDDDLIPADDEDFKQTCDGVTARLYISGTYLDDAGVYTCTVSSSDGRHEASVTARLLVNGQYAAHTDTERYIDRE